MNISMSKVSKLVAVALVLALTHVSARAGLAGTAAGVRGRLVTSGDRNIKLSGVSAKTGDTVFSGQTLETPAGTGASVYLAGLGRVEMALGRHHVSFGTRRLAPGVGCAIMARV